MVRYRSRHNPGRPNWARILYMDHENDVFKQQPNLLCNFFHWIDSPEKRWPEHFWPCGSGKAVDGSSDRSKVFYCSKAYYCNWTNNPVLISKKWWHEQYEMHFKEFKVCACVRVCTCVCAAHCHGCVPAYAFACARRVLVCSYLCPCVCVCQNADPYADLEYYMNWEPNAWNDRPWVVAQGEGVFKHVDKKKWG